ncbi:peptidylprolyl isomerase [Clostridium sp.]|uniref:peptidylprolyl isomerase n=1 Tax=Clostridium sp. TaxID=1506 RepID=UPI003F31381F
MRKNNLKRFLTSVVAASLSMFMLVGCGSSKSEGGSASDGGNPIATIEVEGYGTMEAELYPDKAPETVKNFISLANDGFYDGLIFHRIIKGFMIQGGDPEGTGMGGPGYSIKGEFSSNGFENDVKHEKGVLSMARSGYPDSAGSQFFIVSGDASHLDGDYAAFGKLISGEDVLDKLESVKTGGQDRPVEDIVIKSIKIDTKGVKYDEPQKLNG